MTLGILSQHCSERTNADLERAEARNKRLGQPPGAKDKTMSKRRSYTNWKVILLYPLVLLLNMFDHFRQPDILLLWLLPVHSFCS